MPQNTFFKRLLIMKTYKIFLMFIFCGICTLKSIAQTDYSATRTIQGEGYSYQCDNPKGRVTLYNTNNQYTYAKWERKDGLPVDDDYHFGRKTTINDGLQGRQKAQQIASRTFTVEEIRSVQAAGPILFITLIINPDTGNVQEVNFEFPGLSGYSKIPIERYRQIELAIKDEITFDITEAGKKLNYCMTYIVFAPVFFFPIG